MTVIPDRVRVTVHTMQESSEQDLAAQRARELADKVRSAVLNAGVEEG